MSLSRDSRKERIVKAMLRAKHRLGQRIDTINWEEDVLIPTVEAFKSGKPILGLDPETVFDIVYEQDQLPAGVSKDEDHLQDKTETDSE